MSGFAAVPTAALDDDRIGPLHIRVLCSLASFADMDGASNARLVDIAKRARCSRSNASTTISELTDMGWVRKRRRNGKDGRQLTNVYHIMTFLESKHD